MNNLLRDHKIFFMAAVVAAIFLAGHFPGEAAQNPRETPAVKVVRDNAASVVNISTERIVYLGQSQFWGNYGGEFDAFFQQFSTPGMTMKQQSVGSGVILTRDGLIATNAHVVNMATNIFIILNDGAVYNGEVVYVNQGDDVAFIKISPKKELKPVKFGKTTDLFMGETIVAIGNSYGLQNSVTVGVVSGEKRKFYLPTGELLFDNLIQIDAPINPGNSGGALLNLNGEMIGMNLAVVQTGQSVGFAIPTEKVKEDLDMYNSGKVPVGMTRTTERTVQRNLVPAQTQGSSVTQNVSLSPDIKIEENGDAYIFRANMPGVDKDKVNITIRDNTITISGQRVVESESKDEATGFYAAQKSFSSFSRTLPLPGPVDETNAVTTVEGDTIIVTLPKK